MEEYLWLIIILGLGILIALITVFINYFKKLLKSQNQFFQDQVKKRNGNLSKGVPFGFQFLYLDIPIKVYVLSGSFILEAQYAMSENPSVLIIKQYPLSRFFNYSPGKKRVLFNSPFDQGYSIQGKDEAWISNVFSEKIQENMLKSNIGRLSIKREILIAQFGVLRIKDIEKIDHSIDVCLEVLDSILKSDNKR
ncbi:MAG: hypothetical protein V3U02_07500 [Calditrichia bacterium]